MRDTGEVRYPTLEFCSGVIWELGENAQGDCDRAYPCPQAGSKDFFVSPSWKFLACREQHPSFHIHLHSSRAKSIKGVRSTLSGW